MEFSELVLKRRSVRKYLEAEVKEEDLKEIIRCAQMAPSWKNTQTGRYYVSLSKEARDYVRDCLPSFNQNSSMNASYIVVSFKKSLSGMGSESMVKEGELWGAYDLGLQNAYLLLKAEELGYSTLIMGLRDDDRLREYFAIPDDEQIMSVIAIGKKDGEAALRPRKELQEILKIR